MATQAVSINKDGTISVYVAGKLQGKMTLAELVAFASGPEAPKARPKKVKPKSRSDRWSDAASAAVSALEELVSIQEEFEEWKGNLPESLENSPVGEKLTAVCDIDLASALEAAQEAEGADLPLGFGRD